MIIIHFNKKDFDKIFNLKIGSFTALVVNDGHCLYLQVKLVDLKRDKQKGNRIRGKPLPLV